MTTKGNKPRIVFPFVEAGLGHIMPLKAVHDIFIEKYGDKVDVVSIKFFQETNNEDLINVEKRLISEVKNHNKFFGLGKTQFALMALFGHKISLKFMMKKYFGKGMNPGLDYVKELNADLIVNTHFSTLYYSCEARKMGLTNAKIFTYCPDPIIGRQWDHRTDKMFVSSSLGIDKAIRTKAFTKEQLELIPFLIRPQVNLMTKTKAEYKADLGLPVDKFTILLADGAYGAGKLRKSVLGLLKSKENLTVIAVCGRNEKLFAEFNQINKEFKESGSNITFVPVGFTDKMLEYSACCDLFVGKAGASNLAEPTYFGAPSIVTFCATPVEIWISDHFVKVVGSAQKIGNVKKIVAECESLARTPEKMQKYQTACETYRDATGAEKLADVLYLELMKGGVN